MNIYSRSMLILFLLLTSLSCVNESSRVDTISIRPLRDTIGFAQYDWQMDSIMARLDRAGWEKTPGQAWKMAICPHDDYSYVGRLYPETLSNIKAGLVILLGVAHRASQLGIRDSLVFDSHTYWKAPWQPVKVSGIREELFEMLDDEYAMKSDTMHEVEHSLEAMIPFLQYFNKDISIVPILVPTMSPGRMEECGRALAEAIQKLSAKYQWEWGRDYAIIVTTDAVHYGNEDWGGKDYAFLGCDENGNKKARDYEMEIITSTLQGKLSTDKIRKFSDYTLNPEDYRLYKWTWCGRYCVPTALYTGFYLDPDKALSGEFIGYGTSITSEHIPVDDLGMGTTAIATGCHWVGYAAIGYR